MKDSGNPYRWVGRRAAAAGRSRPRFAVNDTGGKMEQELLNIGFGSTVVSERVVAIVAPNSAPMKRLKDEAREDRRLIDATHGRRTRSIIVLDSNHVVLSAIQAETIAQRYATLKESQEKP
jgi:regulator of extracellular matrix RemA (YlzA/DUF370 family)